MTGEDLARSSSSEPPPEPRAGDADPLRWLDAHGDSLYAYARARVRRPELAEDLVQETLLAAWRGRHEFAGRSEIRTWLIGILRRLIAGHYRRLAGTPSPEPAADPAARFFRPDGLWRRAIKGGPAQALESRELWGVLDHCLERLPRPFAEAFILRELEQSPPEEIQRTLKLSPGNVRVRLHRARLLLRECLERHGYDGASKS